MWWFWRISKKKITQKCAGLLSSEVIPQHNNATPHRLKTSIAFGWSGFLHLPNSTNLAPSDYHLFPKLKILGDKWFVNWGRIDVKWFWWWAHSFMWMEWTNCFRVNKNNSILSIYYRYLIQGIIHLKSLYVNVKILSLKKLASKVEIERLNRVEMICGPLSKVMEWWAWGPGFNPRWGEYEFHFYFLRTVFSSFKKRFCTILMILNPNFK